MAEPVGAPLVKTVEGASRVIWLRGCRVLILHPDREPVVVDMLTGETRKARLGGGQA